MNVDAVEKWTADFRAVALNLWHRTTALTGLIASVTAGAGIHCAHHHDGAGQVDLTCTARDGDVAILERLA